MTPIEWLRNLRNEKLAETDWRMTTDYPYNDQAVWVNYRQALRDLPSTADPQLDENGNLTGITWPTPPID